MPRVAAVQFDVLLREPKPSTAFDETARFTAGRPVR